VGWVLQVVTFACALVVPAMLVVALVFGVLWLTALVQGRAMDRHTKVVDERWHAAQQSAVQDLAVQDGTAPDGTAPDGTAQDGTAEDGTARDGTARDGTARDATVWDGTV